MKKRLLSFKHAFCGLQILLISQRNAWIHAAATIGVIAVGGWVGLDRNDWCWLTLAITSVWLAEGLNTAIEFLADAAVPEIHPLIKKAKDVAAGAVLIAAIGAAVIGVLILLPPMTARFTGG